MIGIEAVATFASQLLIFWLFLTVLSDELHSPLPAWIYVWPIAVPASTFIFRVLWLRFSVKEKGNPANSLSYLREKQA